MKVHRFITEYEIKNGEIVVDDIELLHQWKNVLKFKVGEQLVLSTSLGHEALCQIVDMNKSEAVLKVLNESKNTKELKKNVTLYLAILKKENFELVAQKATELGVSIIVPVKTGRTVKQNLNFERLNKIVKEASEQSGRSTIPKVLDITDFETAIKFIDKSDTNILFDMSGEPFSEDSQRSESVNIFIGPEGGFTENEINMAKENSLHIISISPLTLRGETAAIIAVYLATNL